MENIQVAVVTGANKGIGFGIVKGLMQQWDGILYLTARDKTRGLEALKSLQSMKECKYPEKLKFHQLDILDKSSIEALRDHLKTEYGGLDILVNNAAIAFKVSSSEPFGTQARQSMDTNYHALRATCHLLYPLLRPGARVVHVSSSCGHLCHVTRVELKTRLLNIGSEEELTDLMEQFVDLAHKGTHREAGWPDSAYGVTKIGVTKLTFLHHLALARDKDREDIVVNCVHPGYVKTDMSSGKGPLTIEQGARSAIYCALLPPGVKEPRGQFVWDDCQVIDWAAAHRPPCLADKMTAQ